MKKMIKKCLVAGLAIATVVSSLAVSPAKSEAKVKLSKKKVKISVGGKYQLKVKGTKKKAKWSTANKYVASVNKKGLIKGVGVGSTKITAKIGKKKYKCSVKVNLPSYKNTKPVNSNNQQPVVTTPTIQQPIAANNVFATNIAVKVDKLPSGQILFTIQNNNTAAVPRTNISVIYKDAAGIPITTDSITKYDIQAGAIDYELPYVSSANVQKIDPAQTAISVNISTSSSYRKYYTQYVNAVSQSSADGKLFVTYTSTAPCKLTIRGYVFYRDATGVVVAVDDLSDTVDVILTKLVSPYTLSEVFITFIFYCFINNIPCCNNITIPIVHNFHMVSKYIYNFFSVILHNKFRSLVMPYKIMASHFQSILFCKIILKICTFKVITIIFVVNLAKLHCIFTCNT